MTRELVYLRKSEEALDELHPIWMKLRRYASSRSKHFDEEMREVTWEERRAEILGKGRGTQLIVDLALLGVSKKKVGYCVSTLTPDGLGEVDSIYVEESLRGQGIGDELMRRAPERLDEQGAKRVELSVTHGNQEALSFYERHSFYPRRIILERKRE